MDNSSYILPALVVGTVLCGLHARIDVYGAFVRGAKEGLTTLLGMLPYLCAVFTAVQLLSRTGVLAALQAGAAPLLGAMGLPPETAGVVLLRPLSGSAALAAAGEVMRTAGAESRAARVACTICGASETIFFTGSLYMGAAGVSRSRYAFPAALAAYAVGALCAGLLAAA